MGDTPIGYWLPKILGSLSHASTLMQWGREVFNSEVRKTPQITTGMGSRFCKWFGWESMPHE